MKTTLRHLFYVNSTLTAITIILKIDNREIFKYLFFQFDLFYSLYKQRQYFYKCAFVVFFQPVLN